MIALAEALSLLQMHLKQIKDTEVCPLSEALGRTLAEDLAALTNQPPFPRSPLDGYAVKAADIRGASTKQSICLQVLGEADAGTCFAGTVLAGQAVRIMTGAPIPDGADTVVRQEDTDYGEATVTIYKASGPYENYCRCGEDFRQGDHLLKKGDRLDAVRIGVAAAMGYAGVTVIRDVKTAVFTTGSELTEPGSGLETGHIYNSNRYLVGARLTELGIHPFRSANLADDPEKVAEDLLDAANTADLIITTGGVSVGKKDIMHAVFKLMGANRLFWRVRLKPGSPVQAAMLGNTCIVSLSGNPFGTAAGLELFVRPVLFYLTGDKTYLSRRVEAVMTHEFAKESPVVRYIRGVVFDGKVTVPSGMHCSGVLSTMIGCNCLVEIPEGNSGLKKGDRVWVLML